MNHDLDVVSNLFVTRAIVELAIEQLHKHEPVYGREGNRAVPAVSA